MCGAGHYGTVLFTVSVNLLFTFYACGFLANKRHARVKTPVCVTTMLVRVVTLSVLLARDSVSGFGVIATFSARFGLFC